jgi:hypothetical protein
MADRPILSSAPMVQALIAGRKTQTRRVAKSKWRDGANPDFTGWRSERVGGRSWQIIGGMGVGANVAAPCSPGDRLYVREALKWTDALVYAADSAPVPFDNMPTDFVAGRRFVTGMFMPRWASRLTLTVTDVRVQRLQDISAADSIAEGVECPTCEAMNVSACNRRGCFASIETYRNLWNSLHGPDAWDANPWVVAISFTVRKGNIDMLDLANGRAEE